MSQITNTTDYTPITLDIIPQHGTGTPVKVHQIMTELHIYEDMYKPFLTGTIALMDGIGLASKLPISGEEHLEVVFETPGGDTIEQSFYIYKVSNRSDAGEMQLLVCHFCSHEMMKNAKSSSSFGFNGELLSDMAQKMYDDNLAIDKEFDVEPTLMPRRMSFPNFPPARILLEMSKTAQSAAHPTGSDYRFWEDLRGFHFRSIQSLIEDIEPIKDSDQREILHRNPQNVQANTLNAMQGIEEFRILTQNNNLQQMLNGALANTMQVFDPVTGAVTITETKLADIFESFKSLEPNMTVGAEAINNLMEPSANIRVLLTDAAEEFASGIEGFAPAALAQRALFGSTKIDLKLPGVTNRAIGDVVDLRLPAPGPRETEGENMDNQLSNNAMITAINHAFTRGSYRQIIQVAKDSSFEEVKTED